MLPVRFRRCNGVRRNRLSRLAVARDVRALPLVPLVLIASVLAGCNAPEEGVDAAAVDNGTPDAPPIDPRIDEAAAPPNETVEKEAGLGGEEHDHDGWGGASRITIAQLEVGSFRALLPGSDTSTHALWRPSDGFVLEGTQQVEVTLSDPRRVVCAPVSFDGMAPCSPAAPAPSPPAGVHLFYRHASTLEWTDVGEVAWGTPTVIAIDEVTWTDMPHSGKSLWEFDARSEATEDGTLVFDAQVDIVRGEGPIPKWPGHPKFYDEDLHEREVLRGTGTTVDGGMATGVEDTAAYAQKLISFGTRSLVVWVNVTKVESPPGVTPVEWSLDYANATADWNGTMVVPDGEPLRFVLPVDDAGMDSPYAAGSRWRFLLQGWFALGDPDTVGVGLSGFTPYTAEYDIVVFASDLPPEAWQ